MTALKFDHYENRRLKLIAGFCAEGKSLDLGYAQAPNPYLNPELTTGLDLNANSQEIHYSNELIGDIQDVENIVEGEKFTNVIAGELIEHLEDPYSFLRSLHPVLEQKGRLILSTPNPVAWPTLLLEWSISRRFFYTQEHKHYFAPRWVVRMLEHTGYRVDGIKGVGLWAPLLVPPCPTALAYQVVYVARLD